VKVMLAGSHNTGISASHNVYVTLYSIEV
jgi:hypothetical protein